MHIRLATILLAVAAPTALPAQPLAPDAIESPAEALAADAAEYARAYGVAPAEAFRRLEAQEASVPLVDRLAAAQPNLAGVTVEHGPDYRIVLNVTGDPAPDMVVATAPLGVPVVVRTGARATRGAVLAAIATHQADIRAALPSPPGMGLDPHDGTLVVLTRPGDLDDADEAATARRLEAIAGVPVKVRTWGDLDTKSQGEGAPLSPVTPALSRGPAALAAPENSATAGQARADGTVSSRIVGGGRVVGGDAEEANRFVCTSGFVVTDGARTALSTAAHCPDTLAFVDRDRSSARLTMLGAWGATTQDVQIHDAGEPLEPLFHADADDRTRVVTTWRAHAATRAGDFVCHRGMRTGYSCAEVQFPDYAPPGDLCAGPCPATWVAVRGPRCRGGDSGGPIFMGSVAFGSMKGSSTENGTCKLYYYMSVDYLPSGWTLAHR